MTSRIMLIAAIFSLSIHQIILLPVNELEVFDGKVEVDAENDYKMEEIYKLAASDKIDDAKLKRLRRQTEGAAPKAPEKAEEKAKSADKGNQTQPEPQAVDGKVEVDAENDNKMEEIYKLAASDEIDDAKLKRLRRQTESAAQKAPEKAEEKAKPAEKDKLGRVTVGDPAVSRASNLRSQKQFCVLGITLGILYKMNKYQYP